MYRGGGRPRCACSRALREARANTCGFACLRQAYRLGRAEGAIATASAAGATDTTTATTVAIATATVVNATAAPVTRLTTALHPPPTPATKQFPHPPLQPARPGRSGASSWLSTRPHAPTTTTSSSPTSRSGRTGRPSALRGGWRGSVRCLRPQLDRLVHVVLEVQARRVILIIVTHDVECFGAAFIFIYIALGTGAGG